MIVVFFIIFQSHIYLLPYFHLLFLNLLYGGDGLFPYSIMSHGLEGGNYWSIFNPPFSFRICIGYLVMISCTLIFVTVWCTITLMYSSLYPENTFMESMHTWVLVENSVGMRLSIFLRYSRWCLYRTA